MSDLSKAIESARALGLVTREGDETYGERPEGVVPHALALAVVARGHEGTEAHVLAMAVLEADRGREAARALLADIAALVGRDDVTPGQDQDHGVLYAARAFVEGAQRDRSELAAATRRAEVAEAAAREAHAIARAHGYEGGEVPGATQLLREVGSRIERVLAPVVPDAADARHLCRCGGGTGDPPYPCICGGRPWPAKPSALGAEVGT